MQKTAIRVLEAAFVGYPVTNVARARRFYETVLNLTPEVVHEHEGKCWIEYNLNGITLALTNMSDEWKPSPTGPSLALEVDDFEQAVQALRTEGVIFHMEPFETPVCTMCVVEDPEGNSLMIHKRHPESAF